MNLAPLPTGVLRMRAGLDELVFYPDQRPILPDRLSAMTGSGCGTRRWNCCATSVLHHASWQTWRPVVWWANPLT